MPADVPIHKDHCGRRLSTITEKLKLFRGFWILLEKNLMNMRTFYEMIFLWSAICGRRVSALKFLVKILICIGTSMFYKCIKYRDRTPLIAFYDDVNIVNQSKMDLKVLLHQSPNSVFA